MTTDEQFLSWGWRIPFLFSIVLVLGALWVRNGMEESAEFEQQQHNQAAAKTHPGYRSAVTTSRCFPEDYCATAVRVADDVHRYRLCT